MLIILNIMKHLFTECGRNSCNIEDTGLVGCDAAFWETSSWCSKGAYCHNFQRLDGPGQIAKIGYKDTIESEDSILLQDAGNHPPSDGASHPRMLESSVTLLWKSQNLQVYYCLLNSLSWCNFKCNVKMVWSLDCVILNAFTLCELNVMGCGQTLETHGIFLRT